MQHSLLYVIIDLTYKYGFAIHIKWPNFYVRITKLRKVHFMLCKAFHNNKFQKKEKKWGSLILCYGNHFITPSFSKKKKSFESFILCYGYHFITPSFRKKTATLILFYGKHFITPSFIKGIKKIKYYYTDYRIIRKYTNQKIP